MNINTAIKSVLHPFVDVVVYGEYAGDADEYITFEYEEKPSLFADDSAEAIIYNVTIRWFIPVEDVSLEKKNLLCSTLEDADFIYPSVMSNYSDGVMEYIFSTEYLEQV